MKLILALAVGVIVSACSSVPVQVREPQRAENNSLLACDYARMQTIDRVAQQRGVYVEWVHCPTLKRDRT
jgi:starvation-inducible outer membrane lipoprotein